MDSGIFLARRLGHHLHAGIQDFIAGHDQPRIAAAEQLREHAPEVFVDLVEGVGQQVARFEIDLVDGVLQRRHRLVEVGVLRVEESLSLAAAGQLEFLVGKWSGTEVRLDNEELLIMKESDIMGVLEGQAAAKKAA